MAPIALCVHRGHRKNVPSDFGLLHWCELPTDNLAIKSRIAAASLSTPYCHIRASSRSYLAIRVLRQLATDDGHRFPIIENSIYVDDTLFGEDSLHELHEARSTHWPDERRRISAAQIDSQRPEASGRHSQQPTRAHQPFPSQRRHAENSWTLLATASRRLLFRNSSVDDDHFYAALNIIIRRQTLRLIGMGRTRRHYR